jgi:cytochrome c oxidase subunit III
MEAVQNISEKEQIKNKVAIPLLAIAIGSMIMLFAGLTSAYVVRHGEGNWQALTLPFQFYLSTAVILISSLTMNLALIKIKKNDYKASSTFLLYTFGLGFIFLGMQFSGWSNMIGSGVYFTGKNANASGSFFYMLTALHAAHIVGGFVALAITTYNSQKGKYSSNKYLGIKLCSIYWHFLDILWIYLFIFLMNVQ